MSFEPPSSLLEYFTAFNYASLIIITVVVYDYILTLPREIDYVWRRHWTRVSTMYILSRYLGIFLAINNALLMSVFLPGLAELGPSITCAGFYLAGFWVKPVFFAASELVMMLRVYAMWNRSRVILGILLFAFIPHIISEVAFAVFYDKGVYAAIPISDSMWFCGYYLLEPNLTTTSLMTSIPRSVLGALLLIFSLSQIMREFIETYKVRRQRQPNKYMKLFTRDGMLFFIMSMLTYTSFAPANPILDAESTSMISLVALRYLYFGPFIPHLIISTRELYDRDVRGHSEGIDTGFGVLSHPTSSGNGTTSAIVFMDTATQQDLRTEGDMEDSG